MRKYKAKREKIVYIEDVDQMVEIARNDGIEISQIDMEKIWSDYSESKGAGWLSTFNEDMIVVSVIKEFGCQIKYCKNCLRELEESIIEDYTYQCIVCDEDFYEFEGISSENK